MGYITQSYRMPPFLRRNPLSYSARSRPGVVRNLEEGFALEFVHEQLTETLEDSITAR